jgi:hypothetical protein
VVCAALRLAAGAALSGPAILALQIADPPGRWASLGFAVSADGRCAVGATELELGAAGAAGIVGWTLRGEGPPSIDGIPTRWRTDVVAGGSRHPNSAAAIDHVVLTTPDVERTSAALQAAGMKLRRESTRGGRRQQFFRHGEASLELVGPAEGAARLWGLTVTVSDLDAAAALLGDRLGPAHDAVQGGRRIATLRPQAGLSVPVALMTP